MYFDIAACAATLVLCCFVVASNTSFVSASCRLLLLTAVAAVSIAPMVRGSDPATRRQVMSAHMEYALGWDGTGVVIGQVEPDLPHAHANVPFIGRLGDVASPYAATSGSRHALEVAGVMISNDPVNRGMAPARGFSPTPISTTDSEPLTMIRSKPSAGSRLLCRSRAS